MLYARPFHEDMVLRIGHAYQQATEWHLQRPELAWAASG
jgi:aspartyl-tRNA(Asn)/glutamyl-tRNA(Gln) amidotransferase subunit A